MRAKQHVRIWKWIQNNLEIYRILESAIDTSPVQKNNFVFIKQKALQMKTVPRSTYVCKFQYKGKYTFILHLADDFFLLKPMRTIQSCTCAYST